MTAETNPVDVLVPYGMTEVSKEQFFAAIRNDTRDVMPAMLEWTVNRELSSIWYPRGARSPFGWSHEDGRYAIARIGGEA